MAIKEYEARQSHLNYLLSLPEESEVCSTCGFPEELHASDDHSFTPWPVAIVIERIRISLRE